MATASWALTAQTGGPRGPKGDEQRGLRRTSSQSNQPAAQRRRAAAVEEEHEDEDADDSWADGLQQKSDAKGKGKGQRQKKKGGRTLRELEALVEDMALLQITVNGQHKEMWAMATRTFIVKTVSPLVGSVKTAGKHYDETCTGISPEVHGKGPPAIHTGMALVKSLSEDPAVTPETKQNLTDIMATVATMSAAEATQAYKVIKMAKCWKKDFTKITIAFDQTIEPIIVKAMLQVGAVQKYGKAPPGALEASISMQLG